MKLKLSRLLLPLLLAAAGAWGTTRTAATTDYAACSTAVAQSTDGDTVVVPAGSSTWTKCLVYTSGIVLLGSGIGQTIITRQVNDNYNGALTYKPNDAARLANKFARIHGIEIRNVVTGSNDIGILIMNDSVGVISRVRIDSCRVSNLNRGIYIRGSIYGVADNNIIDSVHNGIDYEGANGGRIQWLNLPRVYGDSSNFYVEDCIFHQGSNSGQPHAGGQGGRMVARYNEYSDFHNNMSPVFDTHGNQYLGGISGIYGSMICEWYGNKIDLGTYGAGTYYDQRGAWALFFYNDIKSTNSTTKLYVREEFIDSVFPYPNSFVMKVSNSYYWNNRRNNTTPLTTSINTDYYQREPDSLNNPAQLLENREFWNQQVSFDGTVGMGCGTLANRPSTCTVGTAYWATDQAVDSIWQNSIGNRPVRPISGTLYKCLSTNVWTEYYTPYTYPHPLRGSAAPALQKKEFKATIQR